MRETKVSAVAIWLVTALLLITSCTSHKSAPSAVTDITSPTAPPSAEPFLFTGTDGSVYLSWVKDIGDTSELFFSKLEGEQWTTPTRIDSGSNWFVNWADYPMMGSNGNNFLASYLAMSGPGKYSYDIKITTSADKGQTWNKPFVLNEDGKEAEHGFTSFMPYQDNFFVSWLDGRNTVATETEGHHHDSHPSMSLRGAVLNNQGVKLNEWELDRKTCDCCGTSAAITSLGPVVVYRDRSDHEVRDISIVRLINGQWTQPQLIYNDNWEITGCPVNGPRVIARGEQVAVAWFSMPHQEAQVKVVFSDNHGETFGKPVRVDQGKPIGRVDLEWLDDDAVFVLWMEGPSIMGAKVEPAGLIWSMKIGESSEARSSGFPQVTRTNNDQLILAWTDDQQKIIKTARIKL